MVNNDKLSQESQELLVYLSKLNCSISLAAEQQRMYNQAFMRLSFVKEIYSTLGFEKKEQDASELIKNVESHLKKRYWDFSNHTRQAKSLLTFLQANEDDSPHNADTNYSPEFFDIVEYLAVQFFYGGKIIVLQNNLESNYLSRESLEFSYQCYGFLGDYTKTNIIREKINSLNLIGNEDKYHRDRALHYAKYFLSSLCIADQVLHSWDSKSNNDQRNILR